MEISIRLAVEADIAELHTLIEASVHGLQARDYTAEQLDCALGTVYGVDTQLIADATYFVAHVASDTAIAGCGGWSKRTKLYGGDHWTSGHERLLDPQIDAAKIRAFFVQPNWSRRGIGAKILAQCETAARAAGFCRFELAATLTGVAFYSAYGYEIAGTAEIALQAGLTLRVVQMAKPARSGVQRETSRRRLTDGQ